MDGVVAMLCIVYFFFVSPHKSFFYQIGIGHILTYFDTFMETTLWEEAQTITYEH